MNRSIFRWQVAGFLFTSVCGTFLHFLFDMSGRNMIAALFSAVNESTWEHMKLIYYSMLPFALVESRSWGKNRAFWCIKLVGILLGLLLIPVIYYSYTGILGISADWFNIAIFFIAAGSAYWAETLLFQRKYTCLSHPSMALLMIGLIGVIFTVWTFFPPHIPVFQDPLTGTFGIQW